MKFRLTLVIEIPDEWDESEWDESDPAAAGRLLDRLATEAAERAADAEMSDFVRVDE